MKQFIATFAIIFSTLSTNPLTSEDIHHESITILGGGVGSLTSAIYLSRAGLSPLVIEGPNPGGLLTQSNSVQNWPGEIEIDGTELTSKMRKQAEVNGARFSNSEVVDIDFSKKPFTISLRSLDGENRVEKITTDSCIIAMGTKPNFLQVPGEQTYWGRGVTNCAICDGTLYRDKVVGVVGGGDAAIVEALYLSNIAKEVHVFVRKDALRASEEKRIQILKEKPNVKLVFNTQVKEIKGDIEKLSSVVLEQKGKKFEFPLDGLFLAIGSTPNTSLFKQSLALDAEGYIQLKQDQETSLKGVFAIGDIVDPVFKQAISAAGDGAKAALQVQRFLSDKENKLIVKSDPIVLVEKTISNKVIEIESEDQFYEEISTSEVPVFVDFYGPWCGPCKRVAPVLDEYANRLKGKAKIFKVNTDKLQRISKESKIAALPTLIQYDLNGKEVTRRIGPDQIKALLEQFEKGN